MHFKQNTKAENGERYGASDGDEENDWLSSWSCDFAIDKRKQNWRKRWKKGKQRHCYALTQLVVVLKGRSFSWKQYVESYDWREELQIREEEFEEEYESEEEEEEESEDE